MPTDDTPANISLLSGGPELLERIEPLWLELRRHHADLAPVWRDEMDAMTFAGRREGLIKKGPGGLLVLLAVVNHKPVGYCVCTLAEDRRGEVDSIYVEPDHRDRGDGRAMLAQGMTWLQERAADIIVEVLAGNDAALRLYENLGFHARMIRMRHVPPKS